MSKKVPVQKGEIRINEPTMKHQSYIQRAVEDYNNDMMRRDMTTMEFMTPKPIRK